MRPLCVTLLVGLCGCIGHKSTAKVVDPTLLAEGEMLERSGGKRGDFDLGAYHFVQTSLDRLPAPNASTGLSPDGLSRPSERVDLTMSMVIENRAWTGRCKALREPTGRQDFAAVTEEFHDVVRIDCTFDDGSGGAWVFAMQGSLAANLGGTLTPQHASFVGGRLEVEVLMWRSVYDRIRRHLPHAVGQVRLRDTTVAAMILARPEQAWRAVETPPEMLDASMVVLGALRMLPLGFEG
ncbi:MAG: hypothetical protein AAGA54_37420 [Myxococcota bacterium]